MKSSQVVRGLAVTLLVGLAVFLVVDDGKHDSAAIALAALALASFLAFIDPATLFADLTEFQVGPLAGKISRDARTAAEQTASEEPDKQAGEIAEPLEKTLLALRLRLEAKLAYLAKHQLVGTGAATFLTIGSLHHDGGLTDEQAETATRVLTLRDDELAHLPNVERDAFLEAARKLVSNIRASVHYNLTYQALKEQEKERS
ncbi:MAG TPA: hypothetical protein VK356_02370, partial [Thermomicrobiales bacterium]|nr:hypothetical protein [Thermomicrobiales bacterium]